MATVTQIRDGLKARLETISGLIVRARLSGQVTSHTAVIRPGEPAINYDSTMARGSDELNFIVTVVVSVADSDLGQSQLDPYLDGSGTKSVKAAIEGDETLGGIVSFARVAACADYGDIAVGGIEYIGANFLIEVTT